MADDAQSQELAEPVVELIAAVAREAMAAADRTAAFLEVLGLADLPLTAQFLLDLGAAMTLAWWERRKLFGHRRQGLPGGEAALRQVLGLPSDPPAAAENFDDLSTRVMRFYVEHMAWRGRTDLAADVELDSVDEERLIDALADALWALRSRNPSNL